MKVGADRQDKVDDHWIPVLKYTHILYIYIMDKFTHISSQGAAPNHNSELYMYVSLRKGAYGGRACCPWKDSSLPQRPPSAIHNAIGFDGHCLQRFFLRIRDENKIMEIDEITCLYYYMLSDHSSAFEFRSNHLLWRVQAHDLASSKPCSPWKVWES